MWVLFTENANYGVMDTGLAMPKGIEGAIVAGQGTPKATVVLPGGGKYRLYCYIFDLGADGKRKGAVAYANRPLKGSGAPPKLALPPSRLPFAVYADGAKTPYIPSGYMGSDVSKLSVDEKCRENPHSGETCLKVKWSAPDGWGALNWQSPANDWGDAPGGANLTGAKFLQFWARGLLGDEKVSFHLGGIGKDRPYPDSGKAERKDLILTAEWKRTASIWRALTSPASRRASVSASVAKAPLRPSSWTTSSMWRSKPLGARVRRIADAARPAVGPYHGWCIEKIWWPAMRWG